MARYESVTPDEYHDPLFPPVHVWHYTYRIPDGHIVPNPPRPKPDPKPEVARTPSRYEWRVLWMTLAVVALGVLIGVLR